MRNDNNVREQITKDEFRILYFKYGVLNDGWTQNYWNLFFENETNKEYFYTQPETPESTKMFITSDSTKHAMFFLTEDAEEILFTFPGNENV